MSALGAIILATALSLIGFAAMPRALRPRRARHTLFASLSFGALIVGWCAFLAGTFIGTSVIVPLFLVATLISLVRAREWARMARRALRDVRALIASNKIASAATAIVVAFVLPQLLLPVVDSDALRYHLALPKLFAMTGRVFFYPYDVTGAFPQVAEMLYLIALRVSGETAKCVHAIFFLASLPVVAMLASIDKRTRQHAMLAPLLYACAPVVLAPAGAAFTDHIAAFHLLVAALLIFRRESTALAGSSLGAAIATKLISLPVAGGLALGALFMRRRPLAILAPILIAIAPFAIRAAAHTGDPLFPLGYTIARAPIPGISADREHYAAYFHSNVEGPLGIAWMPQAGVQADEVAGLHHVAGLFALILAIRFRKTRRWLWLIVPLLAAGLIFRPPTRYFLPLFAGLALFEAAALAMLPRRWGTIIAIVAILPAAFHTANFTFRAFGPFDYLTGRTSRDAFLATRIPGYRAAQVVNTMPGSGKVMALDFPAPYFFNRPYIVEGVLNEPPLREWIAEARTADDVLRRLRDMNVRVLVVTPGYGGGTSGALMPLASNAHDARIIAALRRKLRLVAHVDRTDIIAVP